MINIFDLFSSDEDEWPISVGGYTVNYNSPFDEPCPDCGGKTFYTLETRDIVYCKRCRRLLYVYN